MSIRLFIATVAIPLISGCASAPVKKPPPLRTQVCFINYETLMALCATTTIDRERVAQAKEGDILLFVVNTEDLIQFPVNDLMEAVDP